MLMTQLVLQSAPAQPGRTLRGRRGRLSGDEQRRKSDGPLVLAMPETKPVAAEAGEERDRQGICEHQPFP